jgi:hypothetical protein
MRESSAAKILSVATIKFSHLFAHWFLFTLKDGSFILLLCFNSHALLIQLSISEDPRLTALQIKAGIEKLVVDNLLQVKILAVIK